MIEIDFKKPELKDRELISDFFRNHTSRSCERTFTNVYLWARFYNVTFAVVEGALVFKSENEDKFDFAFPAGEPENVKRAIDVLMEYSRERNVPFEMYNVTPDNFACIDQWYPGRFQVEYNEDYADYVYESEKLATLSGKKLHGKRNHINKFKSVYEDRWSYEPITKDNLEDCFQMALKWRNENGCEDDEEKNAEICVTLNSLRLFEELELIGGILRVDGAIAAFTIGEPICGDTFVVHIEKAFADIDGAYTMINQQFVQHACMDYKYVNREEDTGAEGLRKAKRSYRPVFMVEKGLVTEKESE
ncbi:MAG: phosphatidylglycerol lysyltransferase domain-containing protein [Eubacteriales bacterium]|nr:phosphatidylglycerol lysyltransferase domain-containing protein [Eubacteriales bacterium]